jgi:acyl-CoA reductase-like NAD-dependent aldehyde dehydrogenase
MSSANQNVNREDNTVPLIINNKPVITENKFEVTNPGTGRVLHQCTSASLDDADRAVGSAKVAFPGWSKTKPAVRQDILLKAADIFQQRKEELLDYMEQETASASNYADFVLNLTVKLLKDIAGKISSIEGTLPVLAADGQNGIVLKEPYGVVLSIAPWYHHISLL